MNPFSLCLFSLFILFVYSLCLFSLFIYFLYLFVYLFLYFFILFIYFYSLSSTLSFIITKSASAGTRTRISTLEGWNSALRPQMLTIYLSFQSSLWCIDIQSSSSSSSYSSYSSSSFLIIDRLHSIIHLLGSPLPYKLFFYKWLGHYYN